MLLRGACASSLRYANFFPHYRDGSRAGQYSGRQVNTRLKQDMVNEIARELIELPRFSAYAKVYQERDGVQTESRRSSLNG